MEFTGLGWLGVRTERFEETVRFFRDIMGLQQIRREHDVAGFAFPDGTEVEVWRPEDEFHAFSSAQDLSWASGWSTSRRRGPGWKPMVLSFLGPCSTRRRPLGSTSRGQTGTSTRSSANAKSDLHPAQLPPTRQLCGLAVTLNSPKDMVPWEGFDEDRPLVPASNGELRMYFSDEVTPEIAGRTSEGPLDCWQDEYWHDAHSVEARKDDPPGEYIQSGNYRLLKTRSDSPSGPSRDARAPRIRPC